MNEKLNILQHSLGLNQYGEGVQHRNHFVTGEGGKDIEYCRALVSDGLMKERAGTALSGGDLIFQVTAAGIEFVGQNSPKRPPEPKISRGKQRYREWLRADCGLSFAEWLGIGSKRYG